MVNEGPARDRFAFLFEVGTHDNGLIAIGSGNRSEAGGLSPERGGDSHGSCSSLAGRQKITGKEETFKWIKEGHGGRLWRRARGAQKAKYPWQTQA